MHGILDHGSLKHTHTHTHTQLLSQIIEWSLSTERCEQEKTTERHQNIKDVYLEEQNLERNKTESSVESCKKESVELSESQIYSNSESNRTTMRFFCF